MAKVIVKWRGQNYEFELNDPASLEQLRHHIFSKTGVEPSHQKLLYRGQILKSDQEQFLSTIQGGGPILLMGTPSARIPNNEAISSAAATGSGAPKTEPSTVSAPDAFPPTGLVNLGNTCYMNATLQIMSRIQEIRGINQPAGPDPLCEAFVETVRRLEKEPETLIPVTFLAALYKKYPQFSERGPNGIPLQHDADECLSLILADLSRSKPGLARLMTGTMEAKYEAVSMGRDLEQSLMHRLCCQESGETETITENFMKINCIITQDVNDIHTGLELSLKESITKNSPVLKKDALFEKQSLISEFPEYLLVNFTRFFWKAKEGIKKVNFPLRLNLSTLAKDKSTTTEFELQGVVTHLGRSADSGHYIAWIRDAKGGWWKMDDDKVSPIEEQEILKLSGGGDWHTAYFCLYKKVGQ